MCKSRDFSTKLCCNTSCFITFYCIDTYLNFKLTIFKILVCLFFCCSTASYSVTCGCSIRISHMTVVLEYLESANVQLARPIRGEVFLFTVKQIARLLRGVCVWSPYSIAISPPDIYYLMGEILMQTCFLCSFMLTFK